jgi:hypothetical protein
LAATANKLRTASPDRDGAIMARGESLCGLWIGIEHRERIIAFLDALFRELTARGIELSSNGTRMIARRGPDDIEFRIAGKTEERIYRPTEAERAADKERERRIALGFSRDEKRAYPDTHVVFNGRYARFVETWTPGVRKTWSDSKRQSLEAMLHEIAAGLDACLLTHAALREEREARWRRQQEEAAPSPAPRRARRATPNARASSQSSSPARMKPAAWKLGSPARRPRMPRLNPGPTSSPGRINGSPPFTPKPLPRPSSRCSRTAMPIFSPISIRSPRRGERSAPTTTTMPNPTTRTTISMSDDFRIRIVREALDRHVASPSLDHIRDPHMLDRLAAEIVAELFRGQPIWRKWDLTRETFLRRAIPCWIPIEDLTAFLNEIEGPTLTETDVQSRMDMMCEDRFETYPSEAKKDFCLAIYNEEKARGTELAAIVQRINDRCAEEEMRDYEERRDRRKRELAEAAAIAGSTEGPSGSPRTNRRSTSCIALRRSTMPAHSSDATRRARMRAGRWRR